MLLPVPVRWGGREPDCEEEPGRGAPVRDAPVPVPEGRVVPDDGRGELLRDAPLPDGRAAPEPEGRGAPEPELAERGVAGDAVGFGEVGAAARGLGAAALVVSAGFLSALELSI